MAHPRAAPPDVTVVFVMGNPRSGTTLISNLLGELNGVVAAGELGSLWETGVDTATEPCGCGLPVATCPFWVAVLTPLLAGKTADQIRADQDAAVRGTNLWLRPHADAPHLAFMNAVYRAIAAGSDARVVVDSSKTPAYAATLNRLDGVAAFHLQVVRDPRGIVYSRQRGWKRREVSGARSRPPLPLHIVARVAASWVRNNLAAEVAVRRWRRTSLRVKYEDLMARPAETIASVADTFGLTDSGRAFESADTIVLSTQHTAAGNPSRFHTGTMELREDRAWHEGLPRHQQWLVTALTAPLLRRYGYRLRARGSSHADCA